MRSVKLFTSVVLVAVAAALMGCHSLSRKPVTVPTLDEAAIEIESVAATELLRTNRIKVRRRATSYRPKGTVPMIQLSEITDRKCRDVLDELMLRYPFDANVYYMRDILAAKGPEATFWVSRASGAFKYTRTAVSLNAPLQISSKQAVQKALDHLGKQCLIRPAQDEEVDVLFISQVMNRVTQVGEERPVAEFASHLYVGFGRRYRGIPVIGSKLVIKLDGNGEVVMVEGNWRKILPARARRVRVRRESLEQLIVNSTEFREHFRGRTVSPKEILIQDVKCGYIEAPRDYRQEQFRPGCQVVFQVGDRGDETPMQLTLPLEAEVGLETLLGKKFDGQGR